jgi:hypothetical protein
MSNQLLGKLADKLTGWSPCHEGIWQAVRNPVAIRDCCVVVWSQV